MSGSQKSIFWDYVISSHQFYKHCWCFFQLYQIGLFSRKSVLYTIILYSIYITDEKPQEKHGYPISKKLIIYTDQLLYWKLQNFINNISLFISCSSMKYKYEHAKQAGISV